jgi:hypothetical protein
MAHRVQLASRFREVREVLYGENGAAALAAALDLPKATWLNYERGVTMPADVLLRLIALTGTDPYWLLTGEGNHGARAMPPKGIWPDGFSLRVNAASIWRRGE